MCGPWQLLRAVALRPLCVWVRGSPSSCADRTPHDQQRTRRTGTGLLGHAFSHAMQPTAAVRLAQTPAASRRSPRQGFTFEFRLWGMAELRDVLLDAGFSRVEFFWPEADADGQLTGEFAMSKTGTDDEAFTAYIAAVP